MDYLLNSRSRVMRYEAGLLIERLIMKNKTLLLALLFLMPATLMAQHAASSGQAPHASVTSLTSKICRSFPAKKS